MICGKLAMLTRKINPCLLTSIIRWVHSISSLCHSSWKMEACQPFFFLSLHFKNCWANNARNMWCEFTSFCESRTSFLHFSSAFNNSINISYNSTCLFIGSIGSTWNRIYTLFHQIGFRVGVFFLAVKNICLWGLSIFCFILQGKVQANSILKNK